MRKPLSLISAGAVACLAVAPAPACAQATRWQPGRDTATWFGVSGQWRLRAEGWTNFGAGAPAGADLDDGYVLSRLIGRGEFHFAGTFTAVAELRSSLATNRTLPGGRRPGDEDRLDVQQLYAEVAGRAGAARLAARAGRFELALGRERLVSPGDWSNARRGFQGGGARITRGATGLQLFWARPVTSRPSRPNVPDSMRQLYGIQLARGGARTGLELYWLRNESRAATFNGITGPDRRHTVGYRVTRRPASGRLDADVEMAVQTGAHAGSNVTAWMLGSQFGWTSRGTRGMRTYLGLDAGSGSRGPGSAVATFNQLYPTGHSFLGYADVHSRQNLLAVNLGATARPARELSLQLDLHQFWRASSNDALYGVDGAASRPAGTGLATNVGMEIDVTARRTLARGRVALQGGASRYFAGPFLRQSGPGRNITWIYGQATATF